MRRLVNLLSTISLATLAACGGGGEGTTSGGIPGYGLTVAAEPAASEPVAKDCSITFLGDSILHGTDGSGVRISEPPAAALMRLRPSYQVADLSQPGATAAGKMPGILNAQLATRFALVQYGMNDAGQSTAYEQSMRAIIERVRALGRIPVVTGISQTDPNAPPLAQREAYDGIARRLAAEYKIPFADWSSVPLAGVMRDGVHPNQEGTLRLVVKTIEALDALAPECKP